MPIIILERLLEICIGLIAIFSFRQRLSGGLSQKEMLRRIEEKDREIERLKYEKRLLKMKHNYRTFAPQKKHIRQPLALS